MSAAGRYAAPGRKGAASPPLAFDKKAAAMWPADAPREDTGPPLSVKADCDREATVNRPAAWHSYYGELVEAGYTS